MVKSCFEYYLIDIIIDGHAIRKGKYTKVITAIDYYWLDYTGAVVTDENEINRLNLAATDDNKVDANFDRYDYFMAATNIVDSVVEIPMDKHMVLVDWSPDKDGATIGMKYDKGVEGDSYLIYVRNIGDKASILYAPAEEEGEKTERKIPFVDSPNVNVGSAYINIPPMSTQSVRATYRSGRWFWEILSKPEAASGTAVINAADFLVFRYLWEADAGRDLDTATELLNSNIPGVDNNAVGWNCPGNNNSAVTTILKWGGDNRGSGQECVYLSIKDLRDNHMDELPDVTEFMTYATWFASKGTGKASFSLIAYQGGTMSQDGYNFINSGGVEIYNKIHTFNVESLKGMPDYKTNYTPVTKISYTKTTNTVSMAVGDTVIDNQAGLENINKELAEINSRLSKIENDVNSNKTAIDALSTRVEALETANGDINDKVVALETSTSGLGELKTKVDDLGIAVGNLDGITTKVEELQSDVTSLEGRVTALETPSGS